jgi:hypothetical protein
MSLDISDDAGKPVQELPRDLSAMKRAVLTAYQEFAGATPDPEAAKAFGAHHTACKAALGHLEALEKLERQVCAKQLGNEAATMDLRPELGAARAAIRDLAELERIKLAGQQEEGDAE